MEASTIDPIDPMSDHDIRGDFQPPQSEMRASIERFEADESGLRRSFPIVHSPTAEARLRRFYTEWQAGLQELDFDSMSQEGRIDYLLLYNHLDRKQRDLDLQAARRSEEAPLFPFAATIIDLEESRRRMESIDSPRAADRLNAMIPGIERIRKSVEENLRDHSSEVRPSPIVANRATNTLNDLRDALRKWFEFYNGYDPVFTWWVGAPYKAVDLALQEYAGFLREKVVGLEPGDDCGIVGDPIGREALLSELAFEMVPYSPEELIDIADREYAWCEAEMIRASGELGFGDDWRRALEHVKNRHVDPGRQPELIRRLALEAIEFVDAHDLATIPPLARETWRMSMMTPKRQLVNPFFTGGEVICVSFPTDTMTHEQKQMSMRGNNLHFAHATVYHEVIPGHHLQAYMMERHHRYRRLFFTPFWIEGLALHWEMLFWKLEFSKSPEDRIGMLFWRMFRCVRIIFSLRFHLGEMAPEECIEFVVDRSGHERENAIAEVRRSFNGTYAPLYQIAYMVGGLQVRALYHELVESGRMTDRQFHDAMHRENSIPIALARASLTGHELTRDYICDWRFYTPSS